MAFSFFHGFYILIDSFKFVVERTLFMRNLLILILLYATSLWAQKPTVPLLFQSITTEQGLPHNYVHCVTQDAKGFIWIGTNYGLTRYDGYSFKTYLPSFQNPYSISNKAVGRLFCDSKNRLWMAINSGGINRMDIQTERFTGYFHDSSGKYHLGFEVRSFYEDIDSVLWLACDRGLFRYNEAIDQFDNVLNDKSLDRSDLYVNAIADDGVGNLWLVLSKACYVFNKQTLKLTLVQNFWNGENTSAIDVRYVFSNTPGTVWLSTTTHGLICYDVVHKTRKVYLADKQHLSVVYIDKAGNLYVMVESPEYQLFVGKLSEIDDAPFQLFNLFESPYLNRFAKFAEDSFGKIWIASAAGFACYDPQNGVTNFQANPFTEHVITTTNIEDVFIDRADNLWVTPFRKGIFKVDLWQKAFKIWDFTNYQLRYGIVDKNVSSIYLDHRQNLWFGEAANGVSCLDRATGKYYRFHLDSPDAVTSIFEDEDGYFWFGTYWDMAYRVRIPNLESLPTNRIIKLKDVEEVPYYGVRKTASDKEGNVWLASNTGVIEWNKALNTFINHSQLYDSLNVNSSFYRTVVVDEDGIVWAGSNNGGLCRYDKRSHEFKHFLKDTKVSTTIPDNTVYSILKTDKNHMMVGTGQGLVRFNLETNSFDKLLAGSSLSQRSVFGILPDTMGGYWLPTDAGIVHYNSKLSEPVLYGASDGLQHNEFNTTASFMSNDGELFIGGSAGMVSFYPSEIKENPILAKPAITNFKYFNQVISPGDSLNGRVLLTQQIWNTNKVVLFHYENDFSLEFSALHYSAPQKIKYQYRLLGFHDQWITLDATRRWANFTGLQPGTYYFEMRASNNDGLMCVPGDEVKLTIVILPPFWQTLLFKGLVMVALILLVMAIIRLRVRHLNKQKLQLEQMVAQRTSELAEINILLEERQEEIATQNDDLGMANRLLEERQEEIETQNEELLLHRNNLERLVAEKTTDLEMALKKAEESDRLKTAFLANLSHEIRTPMNAIIGFSNLLNTATTDEEREMFIQVINNNSEALLMLINDIVDVSLIEANQVTIYKTTFNVVTLLQEIENNFKLNNLKQIDIIFDAREDEFMMTSDSFRLRQIINNLIVNAIKFTDHGSVRFGYVLNGPDVEFYVRDTGVGIAPDDFDKIFDHFHKKELISGRVYRGTGIGLSICKSLVQLLGGKITVESKVGKGSVFKFTIPLL